MIWQEVVLTFGSVLFSIALIPAVRATDKPPLLTSASTGLVLFSFSAVYMSLSLWSSAAMTSANGILWTILAVQRFQNSRAVT